MTMKIPNHQRTTTPFQWRDNCNMKAHSLPIPRNFKNRGTGRRSREDLREAVSDVLDGEVSPTL